MERNGSTQSQAPLPPRKIKVLPELPPEFKRNFVNPCVEGHPGQNSKQRNDFFLVALSSLPTCRQMSPRSTSQPSYIRSQPCIKRQPVTDLLYSSTRAPKKQTPPYQVRDKIYSSISRLIFCCKLRTSGRFQNETSNSVSRRIEPAAFDALACTLPRWAGISSLYARCVCSRA